MSKNKSVTKIGAKIYSTQKEYYAKTYANNEKEPWEEAFDALWLKNALKSYGLTKGKTALDIGAGRGRGSAILARAGYVTIGVDYLMPPLLSAKTVKNESPYFVNSDIFHAPFADNSFSLILDWGVFHHILRNDTTHYISHIKNLLKPEGHLLLGCFSHKFKHNSGEKRKRNWTRHKGHYDRFSTRKELLAIFTPAFIIDTIDHDPKGYWLLSMRLKEPKF